MGFVRAAIIWLLLAVETILTLPVFVVSWLVSAIGLAVVGGFQFARLEKDQDKRTVLNKALGKDETK